MAGRLVGYAERQARARAKHRPTGDAPVEMTAEEREKLEADQRAERVKFIARLCHEVNRGYCASLANPDAPPSASHDSWLAEKTRDGWKFGPVKNPETKEHPCFVPYDELPPEQKAKDYLFQAVVRACV